MLINTANGKKIFEEIHDYIQYETSNVKEATQRNLVMPTKASPKRENFWRDFNKAGYRYVAKKYTTYGMINMIKQKGLKPILVKLKIIDSADSRINKKHL